MILTSLFSVIGLDVEDDAGKHNVEILVSEVAPLWVDLLIAAQPQAVRGAATEIKMLERCEKLIIDGN